MNYLLDTNVLSELRKRERANRHVRAWFDLAQDESLFLSALVFGELRLGIEQRRRRDPIAAGVIERWLDSIVTLYAARILPVDRLIAEQWGRLNVPNPLPAIDSLLAATALVHDLTVVTRNTRDFESAGVEVVNPFEPA